MDFCDSLNIFVMLAELLVIETKLIHKVGSHLLDLVIGESLGWEEKDGQHLCSRRHFRSVDHCLHVCHLLERQVIGEGALYVVILTGGVHVVGADLQNTDS